MMNYLKERKYVYLLYLLFLLIFWLVFYLYGIETSVILYATMLALGLLVIYFILDFYHYQQKEKQLQYILNLHDVIELPNTSLPMEQLYQQIILQINSLNQTIISEQSKNYQDQIDYYTLWVHQIKMPISALRLLIQTNNNNDMMLQLLRIEQYVDMVLYYLKSDHMASDLSIKQLELSSIINDIIKKNATFFIQKKITLQLEQIDLMILSDEKWISFVIEQILSNALKYTKQGTIHIYVKDEILYIEDSGMGIKEEDLPRVFEKGFTGYNGRLDKKASGIGLYLCKKIIDELGLSISIKSTIEKGTTVMIDFHMESLKVK
ncbi:MAG: sensor histidine kinase [Erysipelotrichaceae bacterium]|nr:sensor histidine kinase [Erysipelotrichaceae bacterium]